MKKLKFLNIALVALGLAFTSCSDDDGKVPEEVHDHEEINEVVLQVTNLKNEEVSTYTYRPGANNPEIVVKEDVPYHFDITELNSIDGNEKENIVEEIKEEKEVHFIVYDTNVSVKSFERTDSPASIRKDGTKVGLSTNITFSAPEKTGFFTFKIIHEPTSVNDKANNGMGSTTGGAEDAVVTYSISVVK